MRILTCRASSCGETIGNVKLIEKAARNVTLACWLKKKKTAAFEEKKKHKIKILLPICKLTNLAVNNVTELLIRKICSLKARNRKMK